MRALTTNDVKIVRGVPLRRDPAREVCFTVAQLHKDLHDYEGMSAMSRRQRLHRHMHNEMQSLEIAAQALADFPEAPWALRLELARQCWDETRHTQVLYRRLRELGGRKVVLSGGDFTVRGGASDASVGNKGGHAQDLALDWRLPYVKLLDATGGSVRTFE